MGGPPQISALLAVSKQLVLVFNNKLERSMRELTTHTEGLSLLVKDPEGWKEERAKLEKRKVILAEGKTMLEECTLMGSLG